VAAPIGGGDLATAMPTLLCELARLGILPERGIFWSAPVERLVSPTLGFARTYPRPRVGMLFGPGRVTESPTEELLLAENEPDGSFTHLAQGGWLVAVDTNPLAAREAHPDKDGNKLTLGEASREKWVAAIDLARERVRRYLPALATEHAAILGAVAPVGTHPEKSLSASYQEAIGLAYLSLHPSSVTMTEAIVHETQHSKLNMVAWSDALVENSDACFPSPVRPDPRPIWGVLLAVHAFLPVALLHRAMLATGDSEADAARWRAVCRLNHDGMETLRRHAAPTAPGRALLDGMDALEQELWRECVS
jgi:HEXXH motif-containing protein